ncbi:hypothetical protein HY636_06185 [Candidatus Woesearchaeota archaeon]|nr:hypothetical protein [Candidatus Woesearchaeota archaeon]
MKIKLDNINLSCLGIFAHFKSIKVCVDAGWQVRTLPRKYISPIEINIWGNNAAIILWKKEPVSFVIEDKEVADGFRAFFEIQWDIAKKVRL